MSVMPRARVWLLAALVLCATPLLAHDIPRDVTVQAFAKPEGRTFRLLLRVPLKGIMDIEFPRRERDFVDLSRVEVALRDAARVWVADKITLLEDDRRLPAPRIVAVRMSIESDRAFATYEEALRHVTGPRCPRARRSTGSRACSTCSSSIRFGLTDRPLPSTPRSIGWRCVC